MRSTSAYFAVLGASLMVALVPVVWPGVDLSVAALFLQAQPPVNPAEWRWVDWVNEYTPDASRTAAIVSLLGWVIASLMRRFRRYALALAFVGFSIALGPGLATWAMKEHTLRARPMDVVQFGGTRQFAPAFVQAKQCSDNCAFTSGHAACGFFFASLMLLDPRRRWRWVATGVVAGLAVSLARVSVGAHWLSDVLWAFPVTLLTSGIVWLVLGQLGKAGFPPARE